MDLILASTSRYRRELLARLTAKFRCVAPEIDETPLLDEPPHALTTRLAWHKARAVAERNPGSMVIGSDQVADHSGRILGKPHTAENACAQLAACSGEHVVFHTAVCIVDARSETDPQQMPRYCAQDSTRVHFRTLDTDEIARYVEREQPLDCAGSFQCEGLGIALFERIETNDPTALIGLPLIALCRLLREAGVQTI
ncbi:MAG: Maf family protein [Rudaea sp.]